MTQSMTEGSPWGLIPKFALPLILGNLFQQFYNLADTLIVGRFLGVNALASVGESSSIVFLIIGFCTGCCSGFAIAVAQSFGAQKMDRLRKLTAHIFYLGVLLSVVMTVATVLLCAPILRLLNTPEEIFPDAYNYLVVIFMGIPTNFFYNILANELRAVGDSKAPFIFLVIAVFINIFGDIFCITVLGLGVTGAAIATVASQLLSGVFCLIYLVKRVPILNFHKKDMAYSGHSIKMLLNLGLPMGLQYSITAIGSMMLQGAVNGLGTLYVASYTAALKVKGFFINPYDTIGSVMATYAGQNVGAGKYDRVKGGLKVCLILGVFYSVFAAAILLLFAPAFMTLFVGESEVQVIAFASQYMRISCLFYLVLLLLCVFRYTIQGIGHSRIAMISGFTELVARGLMALFIIPVFQWNAVCVTDVTAWICATIFLIPTYLHIMKGIKMKVVKKAAP